MELETGHADSAQAFFEQALPLARETNNTQALGISLVTLGSLFALQGDFSRAAANFQDSLSMKINVKLHPMDIRAIAYWFLSSFELARGEIQKAHADIESALARHQNARPNPTMTAHYNEILGRIQIAEGNLKPVRKTLQACIATLQDHNSIACLAHGLESFARLALAENNPIRAAQLLGATEAHLESLKMSMIPAEKVLYNQSVAATRAALPEDVFAAAWKKGRGIRIEEAVKMVLEEKNG